MLFNTTFLLGFSQFYHSQISSLINIQFAQVGFEPVQPTPYVTFFGKQMYKLPGFIGYGKFTVLSYVY